MDGYLGVCPEGSPGGMGRDYRWREGPKGEGKALKGIGLDSR